MIRKEGDRPKRSKNFPTTFVGNNRQMLQEIRDSLSHLLKTQSAETNAVAALTKSSSSEAMQIKSELSGGQQQPPLASAAAAKSQSYRQKALAEIRNSLLPFANENGSSSAASTVSTISSTTTSGISSASGLSNTSGSSSPCQSIEHNGLDKDCASSSSSRAQHVHVLGGYDEDPSSSNNRGLKLGPNRNNIDAATIEQFYKMQLESQQNGLPKQVSGLSGIASKIIRKPSFESSGHEINLNIHRRSPALDSSTASTRSDSPSITLSSITSRSTVDSSSRTSQQISSVSQESVPHIQVSRQYSPNFNLEPPPPPPPRTQGPPPTPPRGTTPPPSSQSDIRLVHQSFLQSNQQVQHMLKRMSPASQTTRSTQGVGYANPLNQSTTHQRGTSPVSIGRSPMVVQNSFQAQLNHQLQSAIYNGSVSQIEPPPPYPIGSSQAVGPSISSKLTSPPPYASASNNRQSPIQTSNDYSVSSHLQKRASPTIYPQQISLSTSSALPASTSAVATSVSVQSSAALKPAPLQAWSARQFPPIMLSVKSTQVQKPVLQTAVAPTAPPPSSSPHPPPSYSIAVHQRTQVDNETNISNNYTSNSLAQANSLITSATQYSTAHNIVVPSIPTTDPPSYASTMQALAAQRGVSSIASTVIGGCSHSNYNLPFSSSSTSTTSTPSSTSNTNPLVSLTNSLEPHIQPSSNNMADNTPVSQSPGTTVHNPVNKNSNMETPNLNFNVHTPLQRKFSPMIVEANSSMQNVLSRPGSPGSRTSDHSPVSFQPPSVTNELQNELSQERQTITPPLTNSNSQPSTPPSYKMTLQSPIPERKVQSKEKEEERRETKVRNYSPQAFKFYMEQHVENVLKSHQQRLHRRLQLETEMAKVGLSEEAQFQMRKMLHQKESNYIRLKRAKMDKAMFIKIKAIGVGAFGEVALVRKVDTNHLYAMKTLRKAYVLKRNQVAHVKAERDILAEADNEWVVKLYYSFQDSDNLYFVMDYIPGGDMMSLLIKYGIFEESLARFYIAELVCAVESVHKMGFIHRDIKPDNILIDRDGHIKLTDFGLCTGFRWTHNSKYYQNGEHSRQDSMEPDENWTNECRCNNNPNSPNNPNNTNNSVNTNSPMNPNNPNLKPLERRRRREHQRCLAHSLVGTPNYIAPEVLMRTGYTQLCDWWSVGVILYEMLVGQPPFLANSPVETQYKVINWKTTLNIPGQAKLSEEATELILKLCTSHDRRLGKNGPNEVKAHPFFASVDFEGGVRRQQPPYTPTIRYATDTSNFDPVDPDKLHNSDSSDAEDKNGSMYDNGKHPEHAFFEFTFRRFFDDGGHAYPTRLGVDDTDNQGPVYV